MIGETISHYRIVQPLGRGGMGVVYEAQDLTLGRKVALKFLPVELEDDRAALERLQREARAASSLNHENICTIYEIGEHNGRHFIALELLEGSTLENKLHAGPLKIDTVLDFGIQIADALDAAHQRGLVHRDIKPANIFVTNRGRIKVLDFGLATTSLRSSSAQTVGDSAALDARLTSPGTAVGTVAYMSPEQARGEELDVRSDLFAFGTVLYEMATGARPFDGKTTAVMFAAILEKDPLRPISLNVEIPPKLEEIITKSLEKDRDLRYQTAAELRGDLKRLKRDTQSGKIAVESSGRVPAASVTPTTPQKKSWRRNRSGGPDHGSRSHLLSPRQTETRRFECSRVAADHELHRLCWIPCALSRRTHAHVRARTTVFIRRPWRGLRENPSGWRSGTPHE